MGKKIGLEAKLYRNTGTYESPSWAEMTNVRDLTLNVEKGEADVTTRGATWRLTRATLKDAGVEFEMLWDTADAAFTAIQQAFFNGTSLELAIMDGDVAAAGSQGLRATFEVMNFSRSEPLEEAMTVSVTVKPTSADNAPEWLTVTT